MAEPGARYRLLLRAYPPGPRREEVLGTLIEAGRSWPTPREVANLLRHGLRARLGRPRSRGVVVLSLLTALAAGYLAGAVGYRIALRDAPALPRAAALAEIQGTLFPGRAAWAEQEGDLLTDPGVTSTAEVLQHGHSEDFRYASVTIGPDDRLPAGDHRTWTEEAAARLVAAGWDAGAVVESGPTDNETGELVPDGTYLQARRGALTMEVTTGTSTVDLPPGQFDVTAIIARFPPRSAAVIAVAAGLPAALLGWLVFGWASRRTERSSVPVRFLTREPTVIAMVVLIPHWLGGASGFVAEAFRLGLPDQPFWAATVTWGYGSALFAGTLGLLALVVATAAGRPAAARRKA